LAVCFNDSQVIGKQGRNELGSLGPVVRGGAPCRHWRPAIRGGRAGRGLPRRGKRVPGIIIRQSCRGTPTARWVIFRGGCRPARPPETDSPMAIVLQFPRLPLRDRGRPRADLNRRSSRSAPPNAFARSSARERSSIFTRFDVFALSRARVRSSRFMVGAAAAHAAVQAGILCAVRALIAFNKQASSRTTWQLLDRGCCVAVTIKTAGQLHRAASLVSTIGQHY
jgi:hypothetical protein